MQAIIATETLLRQFIRIDSAIIDAIEDGFSAMSAGKVNMPPIMRLDIPEHNGEVDAKTAYVPGLDSFAIKVSPGFFNNHHLGLPSTSGLMILLSSKTGFVQAVLLDNGYLTDIRTGAAGAIAAKHLARKNIRTAGVIGTGAQARYQIRALKHVRPFERLLAYGRDENRAQQYADEMHTELGVDVTVSPDIEGVVRKSDIVITTTQAHEGFIRAEWLHPGLHITAMGSDAENKQEIRPEALKRADLIVCDRETQSFRLGELHHALMTGIIMKDDDIIELGEITGGSRKGRTSDDQITICDLTGTGMQDTIIARMAYEKIRDNSECLRVKLRTD